MLSYANLFMYLNMGGEMLYVLRQRLKAQRVRSEKEKKVLEDVTTELLKPNYLTAITQSSEILSLSWLRSTMESIVLCSIMKLDIDSMNKLFDLMTMMVKYQLIAATGPREIVLIILNHIDSLREIITTVNAHQCVNLVHQMVIDFYGRLTYSEIWQVRNDCLNVLNCINVRVSILLKLGIQNEDTTFNITASNYNERFVEEQSELGNLKLLENTCKECNIGSLQLYGDRVTLLGTNIYSPHYSNVIKAAKHQSENREKSLISRGIKAELGMLAMQLGTDEEMLAISQPFHLNFFMDNMDVAHNEKYNINLNKTLTNIKDEELKSTETMKGNEDYRQKLNNVCADFTEDDVENKMNLLQLLDETE